MKWVFWMLVVFAVGFILDRIVKAVERRRDRRRSRDDG